ncbi:permease [Haloarchaeobius sp. HRN-SO-5]|uniref:permease n=1 Tax=Haloarchaeobius sp. HRN-SO-5 TaxID=3446118 RepID=UPI003EBB089B
MDARRSLTALGSGVTTFLLVGALVVELVGGDVPGGILGVLGGLVAGVAATAGVWVTLGEASDVARRVALGYATFGYAFVGIWFLRYAHVAGLRSTVDVPMQVGLSVALAVLVAAWDWAGTRRGRERSPQ